MEEVAIRLLWMGVVMIKLVGEVLVAVSTRRRGHLS